MRYAIISDIHANWQAWQAVKLDIEKAGVDGVICLGDVVGYGPAPAPVLESVFNTANDFVLGNHDAVICDKLDPACFNDEARFIIEWTRQQLNEDAVRFFSQVPMAVAGKDFLCVHAEAACPERFEYIYDPQDAMESFEATKEPIIFTGHTHFPGVIELVKPGDGVLHSPTNFSLKKQRRYLVNVGSVGDPRNGDIRASYVIYDAEKKQVQFRNVPFDVEAYRMALLASKLPTRPALFKYMHDRPETHRQMTKEDREAARRDMGFTARFAAPESRNSSRAKVGAGSTRKIKVRRRPDGGGVVFGREGQAGASGPRPGGNPRRRTALVAGSLAGLAVLGIALFMANRPRAETAPAPDIPPRPAVPAAPPADPEQEAMTRKIGAWQNQISSIEVRARRSAEGIREALDLLTAIQQDARGTPAAREAQVVMDRLERERRERTRQAVAALEKQTAPLLASNRFAQAIALLEEYTGPFSEESGPQRSALRQRYTQAWEKFKNQPEQQLARQFDALCEDVAPLLFNLDNPEQTQAFTRRLEQARRNHPPLGNFPEFQLLANLPDTLAGLPWQTMLSFEADLGKTVIVHMLEGPLRLKISEVSREAVHAYQIIGSGGATGTGKEEWITFAKISPLEKAVRLKKMNRNITPRHLLLQGLFLAEAGRPDQAAACFKALDGTLGTSLQAQIAGGTNE